jgi:hypothetical protein
LPVQAGDKHGPAVFLATWLVRRNQRRLIPPRRRVAQGFREATLAELIRATEKLDRIIHVEWSQQKLHRPKMLIAQR